MTEQPTITCPRCGRTSYSEGDIQQKYCGFCHWWTSDSQLGRPEVIAQAELEGAITPLMVVTVRARRARYTVQVALAVALLFNIASLWFRPDLFPINSTAWLVCFVIYMKMRRLERSVQQ